MHSDAAVPRRRPRYSVMNQNKPRRPPGSQARFLPSNAVSFRSTLRCACRAAGSPTLRAPLRAARLRRAALPAELLDLRIDDRRELAEVAEVLLRRIGRRAAALGEVDLRLAEGLVGHRRQVAALGLRGIRRGELADGEVGDAL